MKISKSGNWVVKIHLPEAARGQIDQKRGTKDLSSYIRALIARELGMSLIVRRGRRRAERQAPRRFRGGQPIGGAH